MTPPSRSTPCPRRSTGPISGSRAGQDWFDREAVDLARRLLGSVLVVVTRSRRCAGRIVETEAYLSSGDAACHAARGVTPGNAVMFGPAGTAYVYPIHSRCCFNIVAGAQGEGTAVLVRAVEPIEGVDEMRNRRRLPGPNGLANGPAKLCEALGIDRSLNGSALWDHPRIWLETAEPIASEQVGVTPRIGVTSAQSLPLRFVIRDCPYASGPRRLRR